MKGKTFTLKLNINIQLQYDRRKKCWFFFFLFFVGGGGGVFSKAEFPGQNWQVSVRLVAFY